MACSAQFRIQRIELASLGGPPDLRVGNVPVARDGLTDPGGPLGRPTPEVLRCVRRSSIRWASGLGFAVGKNLVVTNAHA